MNHLNLCLLLVVSLCLLGCDDSSKTGGASSDTDAKIALISITSDPMKDPQAVNMALTFAGFCVDEGYEVAIFFNVKGVTLPTKSFDSEYNYLEHAPMAEQLKTLHGRGVELHMCPVCMGDLKIDKSEVIDEAFVTSKPKLFAKLGGDTMVFTY